MKKLNVTLKNEDDDDDIEDVTELDDEEMDDIGDLPTSHKEKREYIELGRDDLFIILRGKIRLEHATNLE